MTARGIKTDREKRGLIGPVRSVHSEWAALSLVDGQECEEKCEPSEYEIYDPAGRLIEETSAERLQMQDPYKFVYRYDDNGNLIARDEYDYEGLLDFETIYFQGENGARTERTYNPINRAYSERIYDREGNILEIAHCHKDGTVESKYIYKYKKDGNKLEETSYEYRADYNYYRVNADSSVTTVTSYVSHKEEGELKDKTVRTYDAQGSEVERVIYRHDGSMWAKWVTTFDADGRTVEEHQYGAGCAITRRKVTTYDKRSNEKEEACYEADGSLNYKHELSYEYDAVGNWIKRTIYQWVTRWGKLYYEPVSVTYRKIAYY